MSLTVTLAAPDPWQSPDRAVIAAQDITFVICVEGNVLGSQAILLCESLRRFGGAYRDCAIWAVSPRPSLPPAPAVVAALAGLGVQVICQPLNLTGSAYGSINRIVTGVWVESRVTTRYICMLDTDMIFVQPPRFVQAGAGVRPVDVKGIASAGPQDPAEPYWAAVCDLAGIGLDDLPVLRASCCGSVVRASYNGGFLVAERGLGILAETGRIFFATFDRDLRPRDVQFASVYASTGQTGADAASWWGSSQAVLSAAVRRQTTDIFHYDSSYNIPLNCLSYGMPPVWPPAPPVLLHYHFLAADQYRADLLRVLIQIGCPLPALDWLTLRLAELEWALQED